jgi:YidC/Oxa1 family membrane protein insertase
MIEQFFTIILTSLYSFFGSLGVSIIVLTVLIKSLLIPLSVPSLKARDQMEKVKPELDKLKEKYKNKPKELRDAQTELYQKYNINPLSGCLPQIIMIVILIGLYRSLNSFLGNGEIDGMVINTHFLWMDLTQQDSTYILPIVAGVSQLFMSLMISPGAEVRDMVPNKSKKKEVQEQNKKEEDMADMAKSMQQQMIFIMPIMTAFIAVKFPSGLAVYWVVANLFGIVQQYFVSGWGGLGLYYQRLMLKIKNNH